MATSVTFNGSTYSIPANREPRGWGTSLSSFLVDVAQSSLSKAGGNFTLTADANFGSNYGLVAKYLKSVSSNIAASGVVRFANNEGIGWRNAANGADKTLKVDSSDRLAYDGTVLATAFSGPLTGDVTGNVTGNVSGTALNVTGTVAIANGGTGQTAKTAAYDALSPNTTKGDLEAHNGTNNVRFAVGTNGQVLTADSAQATGLSWTSPLTNPMSAVGDLIRGGTSGAATRLAVGTDDQILTVVSGVPAWRTGVKGRTAGTAISAGDVGQILNSNVSTVANYSASATYENVTTLSMTAGNWFVCGSVYNSLNGASAVSSALIAISGYSGNTTTDHVLAHNVLIGLAPTSANDLSVSIPGLSVRCDGANLYIGGFTIVGTTLYLKARITYTGGPVQRAGSITAVRIA